jgi:heme A synthase
MRVAWRSAAWPVLIGLAVVAGTMLSPSLAVIAIVLLALWYSSTRGQALSRCVLLFVLLGPIIGFIGFWPIFTLTSEEQSLSDFTGALVLGIMFSIPLLPFTVLIGCFPAAASGLIYWLCRYGAKTPIWASLTVTTLFAAITTAMWMMYVFEADLGSVDSVGEALVLSLPGGTAALICASLVEGRVWPRIEAPGGVA